MICSRATQMHLGHMRSVGRVLDTPGFYDSDESGESKIEPQYDDGMGRS